jgi:hypothetical protein
MSFCGVPSFRDRELTEYMGKLFGLAISTTSPDESRSYLLSILKVFITAPRLAEVAFTIPNLSIPELVQFPDDSNSVTRTLIAEVFHAFICSESRTFIHFSEYKEALDLLLRFVRDSSVGARILFVPIEGSRSTAALF